MYRGGKHGLQQDKKKAFEYIIRSAKLGNADANHEIGTYYDKKDMTKAVYYWSLAAMNGHALSRHTLGMHEMNNNNTSRAMKHFRVAAEQGYSKSMYIVHDMESKGFISQQECYEILKAHKDAIDSRKSDKRERAKRIVEFSC